MIVSFVKDAVTQLLRCGGAGILLVVGLASMPSFARSDERPASAPPAIDQRHGLDNGLLWPDNAENVKSYCTTVPAGALQFTLGNNTYIASTFPHTVIEYDGFPRLVLSKNSSGGLAVSSTFSADANSTSAELVNNHFSIDTFIVSKINRPSKSRLVVTGPNGEVILDVWYANNNTIVLSGRMYLGSNLAQFSDDETTIGPGNGQGFHMSEDCTESKVADFFIKDKP